MGEKKGTETSQETDGEKDEEKQEDKKVLNTDTGNLRKRTGTPDIPDDGSQPYNGGGDDGKEDPRKLEGGERGSGSSVSPPVKKRSRYGCAKCNRREFVLFFLAFLLVFISISSLFGFIMKSTANTNSK